MRWLGAMCLVLAAGMAAQAPEIVYLPDATRREQGKVIEIRGDEQLLDADIEVDLDGLRTIQGKVLAKEDRHVPSLVVLRLTADGTKGLGRQARIETDGTFRFDYIPLGTYTIEVEFAQDQEQIPEDGDMQPKTLKKYSPTKIAVIVAEHDVVLDDILLVEAKGKEAEEDDQP